MRAVVADDVVARDGLRGLHDAERQVVVIKHRLAAGVLGQRVERVLRALEVVHHLVGRTAGEHGETAR